MKQEDFPAFFIEADSRSLQAQWWYLLLIKADLIFLVGSAFVACCQPDVSSNRCKIYAVVTAVLAFGGFVLTALIWGLKLERQWYGYRAIAESIRQLTWKFMMGAKPFHHTLSADKAVKILVGKLSDVLNEAHFPLSGSTDIGTIAQIKPLMQKVRASSFAEKLAFYREHRILDQIKWYSSKSEASRNATRFWFSIIVLMQVLSLLYAIMRVCYPENFNMAGFFATVATAFISWLGIRKHQELSQAYAFAVKELCLIDEQAQLVGNDGSLDCVVMDAESAISREHTLWAAKRVD